jgi:hypothetical protein
MQKTGTQLNLRGRIIAVLLAALMVAGMAFMALPSTTANAVGATGNENVINPENVYSCPQGGLFTFVGTGFEEGATVSVTYEETGGILGTFPVDGRGNIYDPNNPDRTTVVIPITEEFPESPYSFDSSLSFDYLRPTPGPGFTLDITILTYPYPNQVIFEPDSYEDATYVEIRNVDVYGVDYSWGANRTIYVKIDYQEYPPFYTSFSTDGYGQFYEGIALPAGLSSGTHVLTLLAPLATIGNVDWQPISVSYDFEVA